VSEQGGRGGAALAKTHLLNKLLMNKINKNLLPSSSASIWYP